VSYLLPSLTYLLLLLPTSRPALEEGGESRRFSCHQQVVVKVGQDPPLRLNSSADQLLNATEVSAGEVAGGSQGALEN